MPPSSVGIRLHPAPAGYLPMNYFRYSIEPKTDAPVIGRIFWFLQCLATEAKTDAPVVGRLAAASAGSEAAASSCESQNDSTLGARTRP